MGRKTHPTGFRIGYNKTWQSRWFTKKDYAPLLKEDIMIRKYIRERLRRAAVSRVEIERMDQKVIISIHTARPGIVIGRKGQEVDRLRDELKHLTQREISINIEEVRVPEMEPLLVAESVARQLEQRIAFRRAMKKAIASTLRVGAKGIKIACGGRLSGTEIARTEWYREGRLPLQTIRADIDYALAVAKTTYGTIGVKVWIYKGDLIRKKGEKV
jgi:small subunit ribosomal protein S3